MIQSVKYSNIILRLSLAFVFFWFGIDKFFHPDYWVSAWLPQPIISLAASFKLRPTDIIYISGGFEVLVATSLMTGMFVSIFSSLAVLFLVSIMFFFGFSEVLVRDIGLMGAFLALVFWPKERIRQ